MPLFLGPRFHDYSICPKPNSFNLFGQCLKWDLNEKMSFAFSSRFEFHPKNSPAPNGAHQAAEYSTETPLTRQDAEELRWLSKFDSWEPAPLKTPWQDGVFCRLYPTWSFLCIFLIGVWTLLVSKPPLKTTKIDRMSEYQAPPQIMVMNQKQGDPWNFKPQIWYDVSLSGWWFQIFFIFNPTWGRFPNWRVGWVETTNQLFFSRKSADLGTLKNGGPWIDHCAGKHPRNAWFSPPFPTLRKPETHLTKKGALVLHPQKLTWNLKINHWKRRFLLRIIIFRFHVSFWGCKGYVIVPLDGSSLEGSSRFS